MADAVRLEISGVVASGLGKGAYFITLDWVQSRLLELMGAPPYPGTLNLRVESAAREQLFRRRKQFAPILPPGADNCPGYLAAAQLHHAGQVQDVWAVLPDATVHADIIEVVSPHCLREHLHLRDGDELKLHVTIS